MGNNTKRLGRLTIILLIIALPVIGWANRWNIYDGLRLRDYQPPTQIAQLATDTAMNNPTRRLFYVYHPELNDKQAFNAHCKSSEKTIVLGCYVTGTGIYLFNVTDARLAGIMQVTAAHETLHAAYERLSSGEKATLKRQIDQAYAQVTDQRIKDTIEEYRKNGADTTNELHSILGTEVRTLTPELEAYYSRYFSDRKKVVEYSEKYEQAFTERKQKVAQDDQKLADLKAQIEANEAELESKEQAIRSERARLDGLAAAKNYTAYNAGVAGFNAQVSAYNAQVRRISGLIDQYNKLVAERNAIASEEDELIKAIDSRPDTL